MFSSWFLKKLVKSHSWYIIHILCDYYALPKYYNLKLRIIAEFIEIRIRARYFYAMKYIFNSVVKFNDTK